MSKIGIIDADLLYKKRHRFPNLACMKISGYHKDIGDEVELLMDYTRIDSFNKVYLSKVFTDTVIPDGVLDKSNVLYGGTGFFYDKSEPLSYQIEHHFPDYHLYDGFVNTKIAEGWNRKEFTYYLDYSIGFLTRGCFRKCPFCVNQKYDKCVPHSPVAEFYDPKRPKLCFLDDNFFACPDWKRIIEEVKATGKKFQFKQGLDERLLTDEKIHEIMSWNYYGAIIFAFDNIDDRHIIEKNLSRIRNLYPDSKKHFEFYVFCGYDRNDAWDDDFYQNDIQNTFERIKILASYGAVPYIMRYANSYDSKYSGVYSTLANWCNQAQCFHKFSYRTFCICKGMGNFYNLYKRDAEKYIADGHSKNSAWRYMEQFEAERPDIAKQYFDFVPDEVRDENKANWVLQA